MKFVVIGGDAAGMSAASRAKRIRPDLAVTVLEKTADVSYSACGMPYNIADPGRAIEDLVVRQADVFRKKQGIELLTGHCVEAIDRENRIISGVSDKDQAFRFAYDHLLIATGASPMLPEIPGADLPGVMVLKNLQDGRNIKAWMNHHPVKRAVIIGMGYIALEMVEALCARNIRVDMIKPRPLFLPWMETDLAAEVMAEIKQHGAALYPGHDIKRIERRNDRLQIICPDITLDADMVIVAIGVRPNSRLAGEAKLALSVADSISVDDTLRTSDERIFAAGDCADAIHVINGQKTWIPLALRANRSGWAVADNVCAQPTRLAGIAGTAVFKVFDLQVARTGFTVKEAENAGFNPVAVTIQSRSRAHAHPGSVPLWVHMVADQKSARLLGTQMVGREGVAHRINAPAVALHANMTVDQFQQTDLAYAPPFGPTWDPLLTAANQLLKKL